MTEKESKKQNSSNWIALIRMIKTPLSFYVLIALIADATLGIIAVNSTGEIQATAIRGIFIVIVILVVVVTLLSIWKPFPLLGDSSSQEIISFCEKIRGEWWEKVTPADSSALCKLEIKIETTSNKVTMKGITFNLKAELIADWSAEACCISINDSKLFYYWKGRHLSDPGVPYEGFGEISFYNTEKKIIKGTGIFSDTKLTDLNSMRWKSTVLRRCSNDEKVLMAKDDVNAIKKCIKEVLSLMNNQ